MTEEGDLLQPEAAATTGVAEAAVATADPWRSTARLDYVENDPYFVFRSSVNNVGDRKPPLAVTVSIDGQSVNMEIDAGATLSMCSDQELHSVWPVGGGKGGSRVI